MPDILEQGAAWLEEQRVKYCSREMTYRRGAQTVQVNATVVLSEYGVDNGNGIVEQFESRDFLVAAAELVFGGEITLPQRGDLIVETISGVTYSNEVMVPGGDGDCWQWSDRYKRVFKIHTKRTGTEQES